MNKYMKHTGIRLASELQICAKDFDDPQTLYEAALWIEAIIKENQCDLDKYAQQQRDQNARNRGGLGLGGQS